MYNEKIEGLIKAALADGVLTEKEKQVLFKRAQEQGIDLDEFEMVLDARLVELQKEEKEKASKSAPKSDKYGDVRKCPTCGSLVPALATSCPDCGYEFAGLESNLSSQKLADKIEKIRKEYSSEINDIQQHPDQRWNFKRQMLTELSQAIKTFPIPNTKADLFEFITSMQTKMLSEFIFKAEGEAYFTKYNEAIIKSKAMCANDPMFAKIISEQDAILNQYKIAQKKQKSLGMKPGAKMGVFSAIVFAILILSAVIANLIPTEEEKIAKEMEKATIAYTEKVKPFRKHIENKDAESAKLVLQEIGYAEYDDALELIELYIANNDVDNAIYVYEKLTPNHCPSYEMYWPNKRHGKNQNYEIDATKLIRKELIKLGKFDLAWKYSEWWTSDENSPSNSASYFEFMSEATTILCKENRKQDAHKFVKEYSIWFVNNVDSQKGDDYYKDEYKNYNSSTAKAKLLKIINNY